MPSNDQLTVDQPKYPLHALATFELRNYRHELERAIASSDEKGPARPAHAHLQARLDAVLAEQDERAKQPHA